MSTIRLTENELKRIIQETVEKVMKGKPLFDYYSYLPKLNEDNTVFKSVNKKYYQEPVILTEAINKTYPTNITLRYVYNIMNDPYIDFQIPDSDDEQNDEEIANHIMVGYLPLENTMESFKYAVKLEKAFNLCGYVRASTYDKNGTFGSMTYVQFEPRYQNTINQNLTRYIYHVTVKNKLDNILKIGFVPKNSCLTGLNYDGRCHFFLDNDKKDLENIVQSYMEQWGKNNKTYTNNQLIENDDYVIIQVDTQKFNGNIKFYPDPNFPKGIAVFTYGNIPPKCITQYFKF